MSKTVLIFRHEFLSTLKRTGFVILTLALPVLGLLAIGLFHIISGVTPPPPATTQIGYVDEAGGFAQFTTQGNITLVSYNTRETATLALVKNEISEYFIISPDFVSTGIISRFTTQRELMAPLAVSEAIQTFVSSNLLSGKVPAATITRVQSPVNLVTSRLTAEGLPASEQGGLTNIFIPAVFSIMLMLSLVFSTTYVLQGLGEEKENRLMEILLSSVSPRQLITGKVLGIGAAGLVQVLVWGLSFPLLLSLASSSFGGSFSSLQIPANFLVLGLVYFILGYLLFAVLSSGFAAMSSTVREAQGLAGIFTMFAVAPFWFFSLLLLYPNNPVWVVFSIFPFSAPVLVMLRFGMTGVPGWQIAVSLAVLILSIIGGLWLTARLLRVYMLMYGKRPRLGEIFRNLKTG